MDDAPMITTSEPDFKSLSRSLQQAIKVLDKLLEEHHPTILQDVYLSSEEIRGHFGLSLRSLQNYRDNRQIPYTTIGGKILYPDSRIYKLLEDHYVSAER